MNLVETVLQLRKECPLFARRVGGTAEFTEQILQDATLEVPYAFCIPVLDIGEVIDRAEGTQTRMTTLGVVICLDNTMQKGKGTGSQATRVVDAVMPLQDQIEDALLKWKPTTFHILDLPEYRRRSTLGMGNSRIWFQCDFDVRYKVQKAAYFGGNPAAFPANGATPPSATDLRTLFIQYDAESEIEQWRDGAFEVPHGRDEITEEEAEAYADTAAEVDVSVRPVRTVRDRQRLPKPDPTQRGIRLEGFTK